MNCVSYNLHNGCQFRVLAVLDNFTRECPVMEADHSLTGQSMNRVNDTNSAARSVWPQRDVAACLLAPLAEHGNPYDGHTLTDTLTQVARIALRLKACMSAEEVVAMVSPATAIKPGRGHLKQEHRMDGNRVKGMVGNRIIAILSPAGVNLRNLLRFLEEFLRRIFYRRLLLFDEPICFV